VGEKASDFMGGVFQFVGAVLNVLFRAQTTGNVRMSIWADDAPPTMDLVGLPISSMSTYGTAPVSVQQRTHDEISALQQIDPDFSDIQFLTQATVQYQAYLAADGQMSADPLSHIATPEFVDAYSKRLVDLKNAGMQRVVRDVKILNSSIIKISLDGLRQAIVARFSSTGVRYTQDADTKMATDGSAQSDSFTEFATFVRPAGTTTPKSAAAGGAVHCPACGAPTTAGAATCPFCGTQLTGTGSSWLLDKISASAYT
jgi:inner membrane protein import complex subunit Tim44-like protein